MPSDLGDASDHAKVDEGDALARQDEKVPGVRIGVEQPIHDDHFEHRARPCLGNALAIHSGCIDGSKVQSGDPIHKFLNVDAFPCPFPIDSGNQDLIIALKIGRNLLGIMSLGREVEFALQRLRELLDDLLRVKGGQLRDMPFSQRRQIGQQAHIGFDLRPDPGPLNLEHHLGAVFQRRPVNLGH